MPLAQWEGLYKPLWLLSALLNSAYSYFWDLERDWEIPAFTGRSGAHLSWIYVPASEQTRQLAVVIGLPAAA